MNAVLLTGLLVGGAHALSGPDHVAAVVPLSLASPREGARTGLAWGVGHGGGVALLALLMVLAREWLSVEVVAAWSEILVGVSLVGIGLAALLRRRPLHAAKGAAVGIGAVHGTTGAGHLLGVLPAVGLGLSGAVTYLAAFLVGATATMVGVGWSAGALSDRVGRPLVLFSGVGTLAVGVFWLWSIFVF